jgi:hypothetical protein
MFSRTRPHLNAPLRLSLLALVSGLMDRRVKA